MDQLKKAEWDPGLEYLDPTPVAIPVGAQRPESLADTMRRLVRNELSQNAASAGLETFEESIDFDIEGEDDFDHVTMYEQAAEMHDELLEGKYVERQLATERELRSRMSGGQPDGDIQDRQRSGRARPGDPRDRVGRSGAERSGRGVEVPVDRRAAKRPPRVRSEGSGGPEADGQDLAGELGED